MLFVKVVTVVIAGVLTVMTARRLMNEINNAAKVRVKPRQPTAVTKLRQDPATGVYYPAE
ncbi:MAG: hypothetical protein WCE69_02125 [Aestuariivirga sp.]